MALSKLETATLERFRDALVNSLHDDAVEVRLFGSKARGDDRKDSDLDVLAVVSSDDWHVCDKVYQIATNLLLETDVCISPKVISRRQFLRLRKEETPFIQNVMREGMAV